MKLFIVPFAGGNSFSFKHIKKILEKEFEVFIWDAKGKGLNAHLEGNERFADEVKDYASFIMENTNKEEYIVWGYSCGGLITYETLIYLQKKGYQLPKKVFLSGVLPEAKFVTPDTSLMSDEAVMAFLMRMSNGGNEQALMDNMQLIRRDMRIASDFKYEFKGRVRAEAFIMTGDNDFVTEKGVDEWKDYFEGKVHFQVFSGKHFFYRNDEAKVAGYIIENGKL